MADREWIQNIANANYHGGRWSINEENTKKLALARLDEVLTLIVEEAKDTCAIYNAYTRNDKSINLLPIKLSNKQLTGFILFLGSVQLKLETENSTLIATIIAIKGFTKDSKIIHTMTPQFDAFGTLLWKIDNSLLLSVELIIKRLFEDLISTAFELGEIY